MAIGVRITSDNLVGQSASVTFQSITGGTPIDLGIQTIPFNYYNELPYGDYTISSSTYNYVYTLTVSEPYGQNQIFAQLGNVSGETTYSLGVLNFNDFTAEIIDLGIDSSYWSKNNWYVMSESGSMLLFYNYGDQARLTLFIDTNGNVVDQYSAITTNYSYDTLDGRITYFIDNTNGVIYYYNGQSVYQYTFDPNTESLNVQWDWDGSCLDNTFIFKIRNTGTTTDTTYRVLNNGSVVYIDSWDYTIERRYYGVYYSSNYFYEFSYLQSDGSVSSIKIYNTSGEEIVSFSITPNTYINWYYQWYGNNSYNIVLWNEVDNNIDYLIYNFNGITQDVSTTTHVRGNNYQGLITQYTQNYAPNEVPVGGIFMMFHGDTGNYYQGGGYEVGYLDIVYRLENDIDLSTYTFTDNGTYNQTFYFYSWGNKNFYTFCSTGDTVSTIFSITENGVNLVQTNKNFADINGYNWESFGEYFYYGLFTDGYNTLNLYLFKDGELVDLLLLDVSDGSNSSADYGTFVISNNSVSYYVNDQVTGFTETDYYLNFYTASKYYTQQYYFTNSIIVLINENTFSCRVLTKNNLSGQFNIPTPFGSWDLYVGRDKFLYFYIDNSNNTRINLYDLNGALLNSTLVELDSWNNIFAVKDRYVVQQPTNDGQYLLTMISSTDVKQITIDDEFSDWYFINDYIWVD